MLGDHQFSGLIRAATGAGDGVGGDAASEDGSGGASAAVAAAAAERLDEFGERMSSGGGGKRWPRQETLALLKIRSDMDVAFRDSNLKAPLWDEVSRKMEELGYHRNAKKCREKFENVYKYYKRTKEVRSTKSDGKTYRFFDQLEAFHMHPVHALPPPPPPPLPQSALPLSVAMPTTTTPPQLTVPSTTTTDQFQQLNSLPDDRHLLSSTPSSSSSTSSDVEIGGKRKRKWKGYFERMIHEVIDKQEELQRKFLEAIEKRDRDRIAREEAWKAQETARINREHDTLLRERSEASVKDAALISFLQKLADQHNIPLPPQLFQQHRTVVPRPPAPSPPPRSEPLALVPLNAGAEENNIARVASSSRWPKAEVEALIDLRTNMDQKYDENAPKGPLWEEISAAMRRLGYNRNAKRCKEKWENINKYYKKVKESNKKRPEDSKTCPYFHQLEAIYRHKTTANSNLDVMATCATTTMDAEPIMARPEQQWPMQKCDQGNGVHRDMNQPEDEDDNEDDEAVDDQGHEFVATRNEMGTGAAMNKS